MRPQRNRCEAVLLRQTFDLKEACSKAKVEFMAIPSQFLHQSQSLPLVQSVKNPIRPAMDGSLSEAVAAQNSERSLSGSSAKSFSNNSKIYV